MSVSLSVLCRINGIYFDDFLLLKASSWEMIRIALCLWQSALWLFNCIWTIKDQTYKNFQQERNCPVLQSLENVLLFVCSELNSSCLMN